MVTEANLVHLKKQHFPKLVTDDGMVTEVKLLHQEKQLLPKLVTDDGMVTDVRLVQSQYLLSVDYQYYTL